MKPEAQRIAIAEACGWIWFKLHPQKDGEHRYRYLLHPDLVASPESFQPADMAKPICNLYYLWSEGLIPDYLNDLNAAHEMEKVLTEPQQARYAELLHAAHSRHYLLADFQVAHATAAQRAEAFLRAIGKWAP